MRIEATPEADLAAASVSPEGEDFTAYLVRSLCADRGFVTSYPPEAAPLADACDVLLSFSDGTNFTLVAIVDAERGTGRAFPLSQDDLIAIGKACLPYSGKIGLTQLPVFIQIVEVRGSIEPEDRARLRSLKKVAMRDKVSLFSAAVVPESGEVLDTAPLGRAYGRYLKNLAKSPRRSPAEMQSPAIPTEDRAPVLTIAMLAVLTVCFAIELWVAPTTSLLTPSVGTLTALGGMRGSLVLGHGEWWRLLTCTLLHAGPLHLLMNGVALYFAGVVLESLLGRAWLGTLFVLGGLGGSLAGLLFNEPTLVSVGASGAIMGLLAAAFVASFRLPPVERNRVRLPLLQILIPSLIPVAMHASSGPVDMAAHIGGAVTGALIGLGLLKTWPTRSPHPRGQRAALGLAAAGAVAFALSLGMVTSKYEGWADVTSVKLVPNDQLGLFDSTDPATLLRDYPRDPRAVLNHAAAIADQGDLATAERELRAAIADRLILELNFPESDLEARLRFVLAAVLDAQGRSEDARLIAQPACGSGFTGIERFCAAR